MCAMTVAEGSSDARFKTDVSIVLNNGKNYTLRTALEPYIVWRHKYPEGIVFDISVAKKFNKSNQVKLIDGDVWVFDINTTSSENIISAIDIAISYYSQGGYSLNAKDILGNVFVKSLNAEDEAKMNRHTLLKSNKNLYKNMCLALKKAGEHFKISDLKIMIFSHNKNPKIPVEELHSSLRSGGASSIVLDTKMHSVISGNNIGTGGFPHKTNLHIATIPI